MPENKIYKKGENLIIEIPLKARRFNPYEEMATGNGNAVEMDNICGIIERGRCGFAYFIDMSYKSDSDQTTDLFYEFYGPEENFAKLCNELNIDYIKMPWCVQCQRTIYGVHTVCKEGNLCLSCADKLDNVCKKKSSRSSKK